MKRFADRFSRNILPRILLVAEVLRTERRKHMVAHFRYCKHTLKRGMRPEILSLGRCELAHVCNHFRMPDLRLFLLVCGLRLVTVTETAKVFPLVALRIPYTH